MSRRTDPQDMINRILLATESLVIKEGLQNLSMRNIAKEAGIASGTLYLYFKTKDDLLLSVANRFIQKYGSYVDLNFDPNFDFFEQYKIFINRKWRFWLENLLLANQFKAILGIDSTIQDIIDDDNSFWNQFVYEGKKQKVLIDLPNEILYALSVGTLADIAYLHRIKTNLDLESYLDEVIFRTWKAITC